MNYKNESGGECDEMIESDCSRWDGVVSVMGLVGRVCVKAFEDWVRPGVDVNFHLIVAIRRLEICT